MKELGIHRIPNSPMKVVTNKDELFGAFWYGNFVRKEYFTKNMWEVYNQHHADTFKERLDNYGG